jgi:hypothetical protein
VEVVDLLRRSCGFVAGLWNCRAEVVELWICRCGSAVDLVVYLSYRQSMSSQFKLPLRHLEPGSTPSLYPLSSTKWGSPSAPASSQFDTARIGGVALGGYKRQPLKRVPTRK